MILTQNVNKFFGAFKAVDDVSFEIQKGEIVGFLGQNGAGKTTLMRILTTYLQATSGKIIVAGVDVSNPMKLREKIGYLPETPPLYTALSVYEYLKLAAVLKNVSNRNLRVQIDKALEICQLNDVKRQTIGTLSKGFKQRVGIAQAIIHDPEVLILDEPTSGLDPVQVLQVRHLIKNLEHKCTVILSTHILSEIEEMAQRVLIIKEGRIVADDQINDLLAQNPGKKLEQVFINLVGNGNV